MSLFTQTSVFMRVYRTCKAFEKWVICLAALFLQTMLHPAVHSIRYLDGHGRTSRLGIANRLNTGSKSLGHAARLGAHGLIGNSI